MLAKTSGELLVKNIYDDLKDTSLPRRMWSRRDSLARIHSRRNACGLAAKQEGSLLRGRTWLRHMLTLTETKCETLGVNI
jgi:hypothetical protein